MKRLLSIATFALAGTAVLAAETDQYYAWGLPLADSTDVVNARFNQELERTIDDFPESSPPRRCREIARSYRSRLRSLLMHEIVVWAWNSSWVARIPDGAGEQREYRRTNLYSNHPTIDAGTWMAYAPTVELAGVRFGIDKLAHLISSGWTHYGVYENALQDGKTPEEAEVRAVRRGVVEESLILGGLTSGVKSISDIHASHAGIHFYNDLCNGGNPVLRLEDGAWIVARPIDMRDYVIPRWDESFQPPVYSKKRWKRVRPVMETYCDRLNDPWVIEQRRRYRETDNGSLVVEMVAEQVAAGKLVDPEQFGIEAVCDNPDPSREPGTDSAPTPEAPSETVDTETWKQRLAAEDEDVEHFPLGMAGAHLTYPQVVAASLGVMFTSRPRSYDPGTPTIYRGPFLQIRPGLGGGSVSLGWGRITGNANRKGNFLKTSFVGMFYKLTVLRTWGDHGPLDPNITYTGPEIGLPVGGANLGIGLLYRVGGEPGRDFLVTAGVGWNF